MKKTPIRSRQGEERDEEDKSLSIWDLGSPLYDSYELVSLSHLIERHLVAWPSVGGSSTRLSSKKKCSPPSDARVIPAAVPPCNVDPAGDRRGSFSSSMAKASSEFVRRKLRNRRTGQHHKQDKFKKLCGVMGFVCGGFCKQR